MSDAEYVCYLNDRVRKIKNPTEFYFDCETGCFVITYRHGFGYCSFPQGNVRKIIKRSSGQDTLIYNGEFIIPVGYFTGDVKNRKMDLIKKGIDDDE